MKKFHSFMFAAIMLCLSVFNNNLFSKSTQSIYADISADSAYALVQANINNLDFIILDVRTYSEYIAEHIENAVNLDRYDPNLDIILDTLNKNKKYLIHCLAGSRSSYVFGLMQTKGYAEVYNMLGGINDWKAATYPTTTTVAPIMLPVYDTIIPAANIAVGSTDTIYITITNYGNDTLKFLSITDLNGTEFSTNFNINAKLTGLHDYTFSILYSPVDFSSDYIIFTIESNGGNLQYPISRNGILNITETKKHTEINIYPNPCNSYINIETIQATIGIYDMNGNLIKQLYNKSTVDVSDLPKGIYVIKTDKLRKTFIKN